VALPYVPPFSAADPPSSELLILFFEAIARVTPAFKELRDTILPKYSRPYAPVAEIEAWERKWHLDFEDRYFELHDKVDTWIYNVLDFWQQDVQARDSLRVDCGWWERYKRQPERQLSTYRAEPVLIAGWNPDREGFESYATRMRAGFEKILQEQMRTRESEFQKYNVRPYEKRATKRPPVWDFEWLALSVCCGKSAGEIANRPQYGGVKSDAVKKALQKLRKDLHIERGELRD
jgi:hypothetical protein